MCHADEQEAVRAGRSRAPTSSATRWPTTTCSAGTIPVSPTCGPSTARGGPTAGYDPEAVEAADARRRASRRQGRAAGRLLRAAGRDRHPRPGPRLPATLRGVRRRPGDLLQPGRPNRHEHIMESLELFGREVLPEFPERDEQQRARTRRARPRAGDRAALAPASPPTTTRRSRPPTTSSPPIPRAGSPTAPVATPSTTGSTTSRARRRSEAAASSTTSSADGPASPIAEPGLTIL